MTSVEGGAEAIFNKPMLNNHTCLHYLINNNNAASDDTKPEVLAAAPLAKKYNQDDDFKTFINQTILRRLPTPLDIIPALKKGLVWEYGLENVVK